ncbi:MAG: beta-lactamase family protein [Phenylobacterium sp.]|uniref:serine hydrolase domain-containing protein n=1 Tax=Phenylobacterium sp. TaxID=1871053 RepID=UPI001A549EF5|nr:serine hydrolase domain-containing protein [Phenylobacterium sp.]MBL8553993.1 beta-lactamase family protein [Phenylobacterium sp.]
MRAKGGDRRAWAEALDARLAEIHALTPELTFRPGAQVRVSSPALGVEHTFLAGEARADRAGPMRADTGFHVASVGKAMTATLLLQAVEAGLLGPQGVDRSVADIDELGDVVSRSQVLSDRRVTLRRMLTHTSGLRDAFSDDASRTAAQNGGAPAPGSLGARLRADPDRGRLWRPWDPDAPDVADAGVLNWFLASGAGDAPVFAPGEAFHYSDTAYVVLGLLVERLSGRSYGASLRDRIFAPLGMTNTFLAYGAEAPAGWESEVSDFLYGGRPLFSSGGGASWDWGGGGQVSTADDLERFLRGLFGGRLLRSTAALRTYAPLDGMPPYCVGLGLGVRRLVSPGGRVLEGHAGAWSVQAFYCAELDATITGTFNRPMADPSLRNWVLDVADSLEHLAR